jgi:2-oxoglutarate dehydrogenase E1 component
MARQEANNVFALTSFFYGANAAYIEDLTPATRRSRLRLIRSGGISSRHSPMKKRDVLKEARGASWKRKDWPLDGQRRPRQRVRRQLGANRAEARRPSSSQKADTTGAPMSDAEVHQATRDSVRA